MRRRDCGKGPPPPDLLVCFPSRSHLSLMPKPICSPARPPEHPASTATMRHRRHHSHHFHHPMSSSSTRGRGEDITEPISPKVTCAGQIKVRPKPSSSKNWQSVMEEIERQQKQGKQRKRSAWNEAIRLKKDVVQFLTCMRISLDFRCFGMFPAADVTSGDEEEEEDDDDDANDDVVEEQGSYNYKKSKWFMILQEDKEFVTHDKGKGKGKNIKLCLSDEDEIDVDTHRVPPPNALVLMRCRSAPARSWMEEEDIEKNINKNDEQHKANVDETQSVVLMRYGENFSELSADIVEETWVVGGISDMLSRSRSWKR